MEIPESQKDMRIPAEVDGIQVNFCKNPVCANFGLPASQESQRGGKGKDTYTLSAKGTSKGKGRQKSNTGEKSVAMLHCKECGERFTIKSNLAIAEELRRIEKRLEIPGLQQSCPDPACKNHNVSVFISTKKYRAFGVTTAGNPRYRCKVCGQFFTIRVYRPNPLAKQKTYSHLNKKIFMELVNKTPMRGIISVNEIPPQTLYDKLDFFYRQCVAFAANRERKFEKRSFGKLYISIDCQNYSINWWQKEDRRNTILNGIGSTDAFSGYVFGHHINFDASIDAKEVEADASAFGDNQLKPAYKRYARLWLSGETPLGRESDPEEIEEDKSIITNVKKKYADTAVREDVEVPPEDIDNRKDLKKGMLVHPEYTMYAHFRFLKKMLKGAKQIVFYLDQESAIRAACFTAFWEDILYKRVEAFYVTLDKTLTTPQKLNLVGLGAWDAEEYAATHLGLAEATLRSLRQHAMENMLNERIAVGPWNDEWLPYPFPNMNEPKKAVCWLTDLGDRAYTNFELAELFLNASLHGIDRYFMLLRRKTSLLERSIPTASNAGRKWFQYDSYNPEIVEKLLEVYRVFYNYVKIGDDGMTPAMRLGVAKGPVRLAKIFSFRESPDNILKWAKTRSG